MIATEPASTCLPTAPRTLAETGVPQDVVIDLLLKTLHYGGDLAGTELARRLGVRFAVIEPCLEFMKHERLAEVTGGSTIGAPSYVYRLTASGRARAIAVAADNQYVGALPVPLDQYRAYMKSAGQHPTAPVTRDAVRAAFSRLVLSDAVLDQLGPAIAAWHSLFIYGPPGNGKTVISQAVGNLLEGEIGVPQALSIDSHIVRVFDPISHQRVDAGSEGRGRLAQVEESDGRWVRCRRPIVTVGGELSLESLDLTFDPATGFYRAPTQLVANGGVLVVDDFGRQRCSARELLNRWIVPLENRVDFLTLRTGQKFEMPFDVLLVFATNLKPTDLVDEAFLRRIRYKVYAESPTPEQFVTIFENCCREQHLAFDRQLPLGLMAGELTPRHVPLRGCQPRDLIEHALSLASYLGRPRALTAELLSSACQGYFVTDRDVAA